MDYKIVHTTEYSYTEAVPICHNEVHLNPRESPNQKRLVSRLAIVPMPRLIESRLDYFGNDATFFTIDEGHIRLTVTASSRVRVSAPPVPVASLATWESVRDRVATERTPANLDAVQFAPDSPQVETSAALADYASASFISGRPWLEALLDLTRRIHADFRYDQTATTVSTPLAEVLNLRRGVCQDFAHLEIGCLRSIGLPARYVSGYLVTNPPPGQPRLIGADASHAWLSAYSPDDGWIDLDPTNDQIPSTKHITLAWGREYSDVAPIKGVVTGGGQHSMKVSVDVMPVLTDADG
ncbi:MAG TPA: transglutaminase family protein [Pirellulales bacterium]|nr:transglutaminase family protein [Pirellulales bacterium]